LKELYLLTSQVVAVEHNELLLVRGSGVGVSKGTLFEIVSPDIQKTYGETPISVPGRSAGIVSVKDISGESNRSSILRQWRQIEPGYRALEYNKSVRGLQIVFSPGITDSLLSFDAEYHWQPLRQWNWGFGLRYSRVTDSFGDKDHGFGFWGFGSLRFLSSPKFKVSGRAGLDFDVAFRKDDENKTVNLGIFSVPVGVVADVYLSRKSDISIFTGYRFSGRTDSWRRSSEGEPFFLKP
jgi:hypothetical protein